MGIDSNLFVKNVALLRDEVESFKKYPFNIDVVKNFKELKFNSQVTFFFFFLWDWKIDPNRSYCGSIRHARRGWNE